MNDSLRINSGHDLAEISKRLNNVDNAIKELKSEREALQNRLALLHSQRSPIKRVPVEIWGRIFELVVQPSPKSGLWFRYSCFHPHFARLMLVCRLWYQIMTTTPQLWRRIYLEAPDCYDAKETIAWAKRQKEAIPIFLSRSKSLTLDITLNFETLAESDELIEHHLEDGFGGLTDYEGFESPLLAWRSDGMQACEEGYQQLIASLVELLIGENDEHIGRWRSLGVILPFDEKMCWAIWLAIRGDAPNLETLTLRVDHYLFHNLKDRNDLSFPSVTSMVLDEGFSLFAAPYCQNILILDIKISDMITWDAMQLLGLYSNLQKLKITCDKRQYRSLQLSSIQLPFLRELSLTNWISEDFLRVLDLEDLSSLVLDHLWNGRGSTFSQLPFLPTIKKIIYRDRAKYVRPNRTIKEFFLGLPLLPEVELARQDKIQQNKDATELRATLQTLFLQLSSVQTILVEEWVLDIALEVATTCYANGGLQALRSIRTFHGFPDIVEVATFEFPPGSLPAIAI